MPMKGTPLIGKLAIRIFVALLTFLIGVAISFLNHDQSTKSLRLLSGPSCHSGLVSVESRSAMPLRITISDTACEKPQTANVQFLVENVSTKPISRYEIRGVQKYDELVDDGMSVTTETVKPLLPHETQIGFLGGGVIKRPGGIPVSELKSFQLVVWSVDFADGTKWTRCSPN